MRGFVFAITFILVFAAFLGSIPTGLRGDGVGPDGPIPVDPRLLSGFDEQENYTRTDYSAGVGIYTYAYTLGGRDWLSQYMDAVELTFFISAKVYYLIWLGHTDTCKFVLENGTSRGSTLTIDEITKDAEDGAIRNSLILLGSGEDAGAFVLYWNETLYSDPEDAWDNDLLYVIHGIGFRSTAPADIGALLVGLLFLSLPDVPVLVNVLLATPLWACIIFVLWFIIKETIPFV